MLLLISGFAQQTFSISKEKLKDKIKGGWAGQTIGVTFGGPYEFRYNGTFIQDY
ncbi:MAG: ADP-ribosylglycohydrolase family protein, partial [Bacteroidota bacterium]|nr:ADP-ribosylglycohydrolase family protein [Bacteroidota bacterium]